MSKNIVSTFNHIWDPLSPIKVELTKGTTVVIVFLSILLLFQIFSTCCFWDIIVQKWIFRFDHFSHFLKKGSVTLSTRHKFLNSDNFFLLDIECWYIIMILHYSWDLSKIKMNLSIFYVMFLSIICSYFEVLNLL